LDDQQRLMLALITFLHRKRITRQKLSKLAQPPFDALPGPAMQQTLAMAALVRMADGLDYSQTESSQLELVWHREGLVEIEVSGPQAAVDADRAQTKSDLWQLLFDVGLQFKPVQMAVIESMAGRPEVLKRPDEETLSPAPAELPARPGLEADDPIAEAARKVLAFHFQRMVYHEPGTRLGEDIEALHDMRVATRRMRAAFRLFSDYLNMEELAPIAKGLRRTGRILGAVRDLDVFWVKTQRYLELLPLGQPVDLDPLQAAWEAQRARGREEMLAYLESDRYARFKEQFDEFLQAPGGGAQAGEPVAYRLRQVVPAALYQRLATMQAFDAWVSGSEDIPLGRYHQLRIISKGMRYALEFFQEVLGPEAGTLIGEVKALQDHLGDLQDAVVASNLLRDFLMWGTWGHVEGQKKVAWPTETVVAPGVAAYLADRQAELQHLVRTFPQVWTPFPTPGFSRLLASALEPLWL
jgi:CHAD domain-containing protein